MMPNIPAYDNEAVHFDFLKSQHASLRVQQRGVTSDDLELFLDYADRIERAKKGCEVWTLSHHALKVLRKDGVSPQRIERLSRLRVVMSGDTIVTVTKVTHH